MGLKGSTKQPLGDKTAAAAAPHSLLLLPAQGYSLSSFQLVGHIEATLRLMESC